ncbi:MAG: hypothetical protein KF901_12555 [Myxococcales bacterium]|nr:hypothetical protein [Myxococcales bacterium]
MTALRLVILFTFACEPNTLGSLRGRDAGPINPYADGSFVPPLAPVEGAPEGFGLAADVEILGAEAYQAVRVPLIQGGRPLETRLPLFERKDLLLRVFAAPTERPGRRAVAVVRVEGAGDPTLVRSSEVALERPTSALDVVLPGSALAPGAAISVALVEFGGPGGPGARLPAREGETFELPLVPGGRLELVVVPVEHTAEGVRRVPVTDAAALDALAAELRALWPVGEVAIRVRAPMTWTEPLPRTNPGAWSALLDAVTALRTSDGQPGEYYLALVNPGESYEEYCGLACVAGIAPVNEENLASMRVAVAVGFGDAPSLTTAIHELGHAHGRGHAPCGVTTQLDTSFPHPDGHIGDWGWDPRTRRLVEPSVGDFMGYCEPTWISAHNYLQLHQRLSTTATALSSRLAAHHVFSLAPFRAPRWVARTDEALADEGPVVMLRVRDPRGRSLGWVGGRRIHLSALGLERIVVPEVEGVGWYELPAGGSLVPEP